MPVNLKSFTIPLCAPVFLALVASGCQQQAPTPAATSSQAGGQAAPAPPAEGATPAAPVAAVPDAATGIAAASDSGVDGLPLDVVAKKWTGDFDGMVERRLIRVLTTYSKTG